MTGLSAQERRDRLRLARTDQVGAVTFHALLSRFRSAERALEALPGLSLRGGRTHPLRPISAEDADRELRSGAQLGARMIVFGDRDYPKSLAVSDPAPPILWVLGTETLLHRPALSIVGARNASAAGQRFARSLAHDLGQAGFVVASGLARGIDAAAHQGALDTGTIAVLAGGVDDIYPPEHRALYEDIARRGLLVSENAPGRKAQARDFPRRNRIIAGLSAGVVVVEAELKSGSLITARLATEMGREVFAVPGSPLDPRSRGVNELLRQGATLCEGLEDIARELARPRPIAEPESDLFGEGPLDEEALARIADQLRHRLLELVSVTPVSRDELVRASGAPAGAVLAVLVELHLAGRIELLPDGLVSATD